MRQIWLPWPLVWDNQGATIRYKNGLAMLSTIGFLVVRQHWPSEFKLCMKINTVRLWTRKNWILLQTSFSEIPKTVREIHKNNEQLHFHDGLLKPPNAASQGSKSSCRLLAEESPFFHNHHPWPLGIELVEISQKQSHWRMVASY